MRGVHNSVVSLVLPTSLDRMTCRCPYIMCLASNTYCEVRRREFVVKREVTKLGNYRESPISALGVVLRPRAPAFNLLMRTRKKQVRYVPDGWDISDSSL